MTQEREKITGIVTTLNEEVNLPACLDSLDWVDELIVVDSFSTDRTVEIAEERGARLLRHEYENAASQKNWAIPHASHPIILIVDADERVKPELRDEIVQLLGSFSSEAYSIGRENHFLGRTIRHCGWQNDSCIRLFRKGKANYPIRHVHADLIVDGVTSKLKGKFVHQTYQDFDRYMTKFNRYTSWAAMDRDETTGRVGLMHLVLRPLWRFFKQYFWRLGFLDGKEGLILCSLASYSVFLKYAKLWEYRRLEALGKPSEADAMNECGVDEPASASPRKS